MFRVTGAAAICAACILVGELAYAQGSVHHNNTTTNNYAGDTISNGGQGGAGGAGGQGGNGGAAQAVQSMNYEGETYEGGSVSLYLTGCQQGTGAYGGGFGGSIGGESRVCQILRVAAAHQALGMHYEAAQLIRQAARELNGGAELDREAPVDVKASTWLGRRVRAWVGWLPFIGHAA